jgi:hypothetical protein
MRTPRTIDIRTVQLLTSRAVMLALDPDCSVSDAAAELARHSLGDPDALREVAERVHLIAVDHPGPDARRAAAIIEGALDRLASLNHHPSNQPRRLLRQVS